MDHLCFITRCAGMIMCTGLCCNNGWWNFAEDGFGDAEDMVCTGSGNRLFRQGGPIGLPLEYPWFGKIMEKFTGNGMSALSS